MQAVADDMTISSSSESSELNLSFIIFRNRSKIFGICFHGKTFVTVMTVFNLSSSLLLIFHLVTCQYTWSPVCS